MASRKKAAGPVKKSASRRTASRSSTARPRPKSRSTRARATSSARASRARRSAPRPRRGSARRPASITTAPIAANAPNGRPVETGIGLTHHHMDFSTHDLDAMRKFFVETLGFTNVHHVPDANYLTVFITPTSSLGFMPPATTAPDQWQPPAEPNLYFFVADVDAVFARLSSEGVTFDQAPTDMPWGHRLATLRDPEGRRVCLAQNLKN